ncbi:hypothetical protein LEP1GSC050_0617 [Leptospira broomii serovar Hurstbridge str. 5399]|uniref:Uncharacterized protein n=1 Tax=Leptospira broomii serovar Hurstbridge str. 5399 TaxID=1049789 RepID=T0FGP4_9LEPT|nr:hypothetical protein LEP1GSC050_0617 [Leptospira broomii serovar Hurstbridge str. 5399]
MAKLTKITVRSREGKNRRSKFERPDSTGIGIQIFICVSNN